MIKKIHIQSLKSIKDLTVHCQKMNLIVGTNSSGKSTFLQSILLEAQNSENKVGLNGHLAKIGDFNEAHNYSSNRSEPIRIEIWSTNNKHFFVEFKQDNSSKNGYSVEKSTYADNEILDKNLPDKYSGIPNIYGTHIRYLSAGRLGAQEVYLKNLTVSDDFGINGEFAVGYLQEHEDDTLQTELLQDVKNFGDSLSGQTNYWLSRILGNTAMKTINIAKTNFVQILYNTNPNTFNQDALYCRPINVGSGVSYLISILIECLTSADDDVIIIENPEIHLHPKAQSELCKFFYFISQTGRQIFIETHSDHIFNGLRAGIAREDFHQEDISVNFFVMKDGITQCNPIKFGEFGRVYGENKQLTLEDLFDQFELDLDEMMGL